MTIVGTWGPEADPSVTDEVIDRLLKAAADLEAPDLGFTTDEIRRYAPLQRAAADQWRAAVAERPDEQLQDLVRVLTLGEMRLPGWDAGARSPVVTIVAEWRRRGTYPSEVTAWIRSVSDNRFLPYGSLMDRL